MARAATLKTIKLPPGSDVVINDWLRKLDAYEADLRAGLAHGLAWEPFLTRLDALRQQFYAIYGAFYGGRNLGPTPHQ